MKKWLLFLLSCLVVLTMSIPNGSATVDAKGEKPFDPDDFSTYGLGLNDGLTNKNVEEYKAPQRYLTEKEWKKSGAFDRKNRKLLPEQVDLRPYFPAVRSQGRFGTCVPFAAAGLREYYIGRDTRARGSEITYLSPLYIYHPRGPQDGMTLDAAFRVMERRGVTPETERPYDLNPENTQQFDEPLTTLQNKNAVPYKLRNYQVIWRSNMVEQIKQALANGDPVMVGIQVYPNFDATPPSGIVPPVKEKKSRGGHALVVVGYDEEKKWFIMRNSWGDRFGDHGYAYMHYDTLMEMSNGFGFVASPYSRQYPPQGVKVSVSSADSTHVHFQVSALDAQEYELYRDNQLVKTFTGSTVTDENLDPESDYTYYIVAKNQRGETRSQSVKITTKVGIKPVELQKAG
ncbi:C1 family peptidase [Desmospora profundinema]|uniref:C1A family cysteine protease n=1 Tax=Desmospora profundinema TaxID=1571184 RepID=A0ABU1IQS7_9BACL|nr:C1 family peptidase [Desmospora profundinema]MDR6226773.1 C1A family cysteine protease [Desmospora profundinema]